MHIILKWAMVITHKSLLQAKMIDVQTRYLSLHPNIGSHPQSVTLKVAILGCKSWWSKLNFGGVVMPKNNTKQYRNYTRTVKNGAHKLLGPT
jgi:hypothetical protein